MLYHTVDSVVVGKDALAAGAGVGPIINMRIGFSSRLAAGAGIVISQCFGTHDQEKLHNAVQTTMALMLTLCVVLTAAGLQLTPSLIRLINAPEDVEAFGDVLSVNLFCWSEQPVDLQHGRGHPACRGRLPAAPLLLIPLGSD